MGTKPRSDKRGIKWMMFAILGTFIIIVLLIVWFFQIQLLNYFYRTIKIIELNSTAQEIEDSLGADNLTDTVYTAAARHGFYIKIMYVTEDGFLAEKIDADGGSDNIMPSLSNNSLVKLYNKALENGGRYIGLVVIDETLQNDETYFHESEGNDPFTLSKNKPVSVIYIRLAEKDGISYMIALNSDFTPVSATVMTLRRQFVWIVFIVLLATLILSGIVARFVTRPIIKINNAAKKLAQGVYLAPGGGKGYREINELSQTLEYVSRELETSGKVQRELIANVSHDLRTPLTMIKGYGEIIRDIPGENTPENIQIIIDETARLSALVSDMLDISRIQTGAVYPKFEQVNLTELVRSTVERYGRLVRAEEIKFAFSGAEEVVVSADKGMILQVIYNLLHNAVNYSKKEDEVLIHQTVSENTVRISVIDRGEGIGAEFIPHIWDRYYKVDKAGKGTSFGTGLGLSIVKGVLELHSASYGVNSTLGEGTEFWFELNISQKINKNATEQA